MQRHSPASFAALLAATALLGACGGGSDFAFLSGCNLLACRRSGTLASSEIAPDHELSSSGGAVLVTAAFRSRGSIGANVQLEGEQPTVQTDRFRAGGGFVGRYEQGVQILFDRI